MLDAFNLQLHVVTVIATLQRVQYFFRGIIQNTRVTL